MSDASKAAGSTVFSSMTDSQLRQTISQLSSAVGRGTYTPPYSTTPVTGRANQSYLQNIQQWSSAHYKSTGKATDRKQKRSARPLTPATTGTTQVPHGYVAPAAATPYRTLQVPVQHAAPHLHPPQPPQKPLVPRAPLPTAPQALQSTYAARMRTGATLLMQPIIATSYAATAAGPSTVGTRSRRGTAVNYADPGSGDDFEEPPDAGAAVDSDDSDFVASGGLRASVRQTKPQRGGTLLSFAGGSSAAQPLRVNTPPVQQGKAEVEQSYLGMIPPSKHLAVRRIAYGHTPHIYPSEDAVEAGANRATALVPIRVEFETDTHRVRDCFVWNLNENIITPESFAQVLCMDLDLPLIQWVETISNQIKAQLEEHEGAASMDFISPEWEQQTEESGDDIPECRVILSIDVQIGTHHLVDHIEWDLLSPLTPEHFAQKLCTELGLTGEAAPLVAHAIHEEIIKHKKDAIEWGVLGAETHPVNGNTAPDTGATTTVLKDKTGLGLSWGRAPKDGRGPKPLKSIWREWQEAEEYGTRFQELTLEEVERKEIERERAARRLRRETSKFQSSTMSRRRR